MKSEIFIKLAICRLKARKQAADRMLTEAYQVESYLVQAEIEELESILKEGTPKT